MIVFKFRPLMVVLGIIIIILLALGFQKIYNHNLEKKMNNQAIIDQAKFTAVEHLKEKYELDVEITGEQMLPTYVSYRVSLEGNVIGNKDQHFNISVNYKTNEVSNFGMSPELVEALKAKGYDPFIKK